VNTGISRSELFAKLGVMRLADSLIDSAYTFVEQEILRENLEGSPHGTPWHTSFHASAFPGKERECGRAAIYSLMDVPTLDEISNDSRALMDVGKDVETQIVRRLERYGVLISASPDDAVQTNFTLPEYWLTGNTDAVVLNPGWKKGHVLEFKGKDHDKIMQMRTGLLEPDEYHIAQCKAYISLANIFSHTLWPDLEPVNTGTLIYFSRQRPRVTAEFFFEIDHTFFELGLSRLRAWQQHFLDGTLPEHPFGGKEWSKEPCGWCAYKRDVCKVDWKAGVTKLEDSVAHEHARKIRPSYDYTTIREAVLARWSKEKQHG
jgi:hypothetical protein